MPLNKTKGNMYDFVTHTWNPIKGRCSHDCQYCYMKRWGELPDLHLDAREMKTDLGSGNYIFVGSSTDMFAEDVSWEWITIGADSQRCNLPEPSYKKVMQLISKLNKFTNVKEKKNLDRLKKESI